MEASNKKMKVEVWSDIMCPFCYIGKRKFEKAFEQFAENNHVEVIWKSFQLMPGLITDPSINIHEFLSREKGFPIEQARQMNAQLTEAGKQIGLDYNFDKAVVSNTFKAHNLLHFAMAHGRQNEAKDELFKAYFTEGKNLDDIPTLLEVGKNAGLDINELKSALENNTFASEVNADIREASQLGVTGVPFFVFNRKYAVSGAQEPSVFSQTLEKAFTEWKMDNPGALIEVIDGESCTPDGNCD